jgi:tetratricopeptide (TPR) repeat protein
MRGMMRKDGWRVLAVCLVLGLGTVALYFPAFNFSFVNYDDVFYVVNNPHLNKGLAGVFGWTFASGYGNVWQPLTWLSHAVDCQIYGPNPAGHHATNLILHALNSVLVFLVLRQLTGAFWRSAAVAAFFAWHPLHVEVFAWVAERKGLLCAFFWLLTLWAYARYAEDAKARLPHAKFYYIGAVVLFALALMSKLVAVTLPLILLLLDWWPLGRLAATEERPAGKQALYLLAEKIPFFVLAIAASVITFLVVDSSQIVDPLARFPLKARLIVTVLAYFRYLAKSFWPSDLAALHLTLITWSRMELVGVFSTLAIISIVAIATRKTRPFWLVGWLWFLVTLFPLMSLLPAAAQFVQAGAQITADRNMYIPSIGLWMLFCWEAYDLAAPWRSGRVVLGGLCAVLVASCCVASSMQLQSWKNDGTLEARIPNSKVNAFGHAEYADYLLLRGQMAQAQVECEKAIAIAPHQPAFAVRLGRVLFAEGKYDQSIEKLQSALRLDHTMVAARLELGQDYLAEHRTAEAAEEFKKIIQDDPQNFVAHFWMARTFLFEGKTAEADAEFHEALAIQITKPATLNELVTLNDLAWLLATDPHAEIRRGAEAVQLASRACKLTGGQEPVFLGTLAAAYAETGDFDKAVQTGQAAHDKALAQGFKALAETNLQLVALYRAHKPFRAQK